MLHLQPLGTDPLIEFIVIIKVLIYIFSSAGSNHSRTAAEQQYDGAHLSSLSIPMHHAAASVRFSLLL